MNTQLWTPEQGYPDGARARDFLRQERQRWRHIRDPRVEEQPQFQLGYALVSHRNDVLGTNGGTSGALDTSGADIVFVSEHFHQANSGTLADNKGNTWIQLTKRDSTGSECGSSLWYAKNAAVGTGHTFTITGASSFSAIEIASFSGSDLTSPFDIEDGISFVTDPTTVIPTITPNNANSLILWGVSLSQATASCTIHAGSVGAILEQSSGASAYTGPLSYLIQTTATATGAVTVDHDLYKSSGWVAVFKAAAGGGGRTTKNTRAFPLGTELGMGLRMNL